MEAEKILETFIDKIAIVAKTEGRFNAKSEILFMDFAKLASAIAEIKMEEVYSILYNALYYLAETDEEFAKRNQDGLIKILSSLGCRILQLEKENRDLRTTLDTFNFCK